MRDTQSLDSPSFLEVYSPVSILRDIGESAEGSRRFGDYASTVIWGGGVLALEGVLGLVAVKIGYDALVSLSNYVGSL